MRVDDVASNIPQALLRESLFWRQMSDAYGRQVLRQALRLLASVDMLDSVSQALGQASAVGPTSAWSVNK